MSPGIPPVLLLQENEDFLLLEDGSFILLVDGVPPTPAVFLKYPGSAKRRNEDVLINMGVGQYRHHFSERQKTDFDKFMDVVIEETPKIKKNFGL